MVEAYQCKMNVLLIGEKFVPLSSFILSHKYVCVLDGDGSHVTFHIILTLLIKPLGKEPITQ
jgi:hypothetical protein